MKRIFLFAIIPLVMMAEVALAQDVSRSDLLEFKRLWFYEKAIKGALLNDGTAVFYFEETRPATEEEKAKRAQEFERKWKELEVRAREFEKKGEEVPEEAKKAESEIHKKSPFLPRFPLYAIVSGFFKEIVKSGMEIAYSLGKKHFINAPVVTKAGFMFVSSERIQTEFPVDLEEAYGSESWQRMPNDAVNIRVSADDRLVGIETEKGGIMLYELKDSAVSFVGRIEGTHPFGFSPDGRHMFVTMEKGLFQIYRLPPKRDKDYRFVLPEFLLVKKVRLDIPKRVAMTDVLLLERYLVVLTLKELFVYDWEKESLQRFTFGRFGGRSLLASSDQDVFVAKIDKTLAKVDLRKMRSYEFKMNHFDLPRHHRVYFHKLVSISPDKRFIAALYDPGLIPPKGVKSWSGSTTGESILFIWDLLKGEVMWQLQRRLEDITGGFGYHPPACFSKDWSYLLLNLKDDGVELLRLKIKGGAG